MVNIELVYGLAEKQKLYTFAVPKGTTIRQALAWCTLAQDFPEADLTAPLGIFGKIVKDNTIIQQGDRIEVYRPLIADPKEARRKRAKHNQQTP